MVATSCTRLCSCTVIAFWWTPISAIRVTECLKWPTSFLHFVTALDTAGSSIAGIVGVYVRNSPGCPTSHMLPAHCIIMQTRFHLAFKIEFAHAVLWRHMGIARGRSTLDPSSHVYVTWCSVTVMKDSVELDVQLSVVIADFTWDWTSGPLVPHQGGTVCTVFLQGTL